MMLSSPSLVLPLKAAASACLPLSKPAGSKHGRRSLSCKATAGSAGAGDGEDQVRRNIDRRDVLLGLTGVVAATTTNLGLALAADGAAATGECAPVPITAEVLQCVSDGNGFQCPGVYRPVTKTVDFSSLSRPIGGPRVRKPAHLLDAAYVKKYEDAVQAMKDLPDDDPRSFKNQAAIHEAYCANHYKVVPVGGGREVTFDVHYSSIFAPWHRMYIYFYEGILGELIGDPTFGLPYWNWDAPAGMVMPAIFAQEGSPLHDPRRNPKNVHSVIDLKLGQKKELQTAANLSECSDDELLCRIGNNLSLLYRQMSVDTPRQFLGGKFCNGASKEARVAGSLESGAHTSAHIWLGNPDERGQDMGDLGTAARDPVFYSNHSNVDRMWHIWADKLGHDNLPYQEWKDTSFVFYDMKKRPVRIKVSDVLDIGKLGYKYEGTGKPLWIEKRPRLATGLVRPLTKKILQATTLAPIELKKGKMEYLTVDRPEKARADGGSSKKSPEVLVVDVTIDPCDYIEFDVLVNVPRGQEDKVGPQNSEYVGSFTHVPHARTTGAMAGMAGMETQTTVSQQFALRELLEDLNCGSDKQLDITIIPDSGEKVVIESARVELL